MAKAKQIADQFDKIRSEIKSKNSALTEEKRKTEKSVASVMSFKGKESAEKLGREARLELTSKFKEENKELIAEYKRLSAEHKENGKKFQALFAKAKEDGLTDLDENAFREAIMGKNEKKEAKETVTKSLEFEKDTFKISSEGWEEVTKESAKKNPNLEKFIDKGIKVKANTTGDVVEYMEDRINGELKCKKGEQIFIDYDSYIKYVAADKHCTIEEAEKKYLMTIDELKEKMKDKPSGSEEYKKFFNEEVNGHLAGYWDPGNERFYDIGVRSSVWLVGGHDAGFGQDGWGGRSSNRSFGFSGRLLKN